MRTTFWNWHKMVRYCDLADLAAFHDRKMLRENAAPEDCVDLKAWRSRRHMSQCELARILGVTQAAVSMAENGLRPIMAANFLQKLQHITSTSIPPVAPAACTTAPDTHAQHSPHLDGPKP